MNTNTGLFATGASLTDSQQVVSLSGDLTTAARAAACLFKVAEGLSAIDAALDDRMRTTSAQGTAKCADGASALTDSEMLRWQLDRQQHLDRAKLVAGKAVAAVRRLAGRHRQDQMLVQGGANSVPGGVDAPGSGCADVAGGPAAQWRIVDALARAGIPPERSCEALRRTAGGSETLKASLKRFFAAADALRGAQDEDSRSELPKDFPATAAAQGTEGNAIGSSAAGLSLETAISLVPVVIKLLRDFGELLVDLFNASDDDRARELINRSDCASLRAMSGYQHYALVDAMLRGPTGDDDEQAILRLFSCLTCQQVGSVVGRLNREGRWIGDDFQGAEYERLMIRLRQCGLVSFADWDDDTTRRFITMASCASLRALGLDNVRQLLRNLFSGYTGDDDERAILRLVGCLSCDQRRALVRMLGMSVDDFDDEVDGVEWQRLRQLFRQCGIAA